MREGWQTVARSRSEARERDAVRDLRMRHLVRRLYAGASPLNGAVSPLPASAASPQGSRAEQDEEAATKDEENAELKEEAAEEVKEEEKEIGEGKEEEKEKAEAKEGTSEDVSTPSRPLSAAEEEEAEFVPTDWLMRCLRSPAAGSLEAGDANEGLCATALEWADRLLCSHGRLRPDTAPERVKLVPSHIVDELLGPDQATSCRRMKRRVTYYLISFVLLVV